MDWGSLGNFAALLNVSELESSARWYANEYNVTKTTDSLSAILAEYNTSDLQTTIGQALDAYNATDSVKALQAEAEGKLAQAHTLAAAAGTVDVSDLAKRTGSQILAEHPELQEQANQAGVALSLEAPRLEASRAASGGMPVVAVVAVALLVVVAAAFSRRGLTRARAPERQARAQALV